MKMQLCSKIIIFTISDGNGHFKVNLLAEPACFLQTNQSHQLLERKNRAHLMSHTLIKWSGTWDGQRY